MWLGISEMKSIAGHLRDGITTDTESNTNGKEFPMETYIKRKRPTTFKKWLNRNCITIMLVVVFIVGFAVGSILVSATNSYGSEKEVTPVESTSEITEAEIIIDETTASETEAEIPAFYYECPLDHNLQDYIRTLCDKYNIPMALVIGLIEQESTFKADAVSKTDDYGLMQINKINHENLTKTFGVTNFLDPYENVLCGCYILGGNLDYTDGNIEEALMIYNLGLNGAKKKWANGVYSTAYSKAVMEKYQIYLEMEVND